MSPLAPVATQSLAVVSFPPPANPPYGLFTVADMIVPDDPHELAGVQTWGYPAYGLAAWSGAVGTSVQAKPAAQANRVDHAQGFQVVGRFECQTQWVAAWLDEFSARAQVAFNAFEEQAVEYQLWSNQAAVDMRYLMDSHVTQLNGGTAVKPQVALALLEDYAARADAGPPIVHATPGAASLFLTQFDTAGGVALSKLGTKLSVGNGYPVTNGGPAGASVTGLQEWAVVSGPVEIRRDPSVTVIDNREWVNRDSNLYRVTVERSYSVVFDYACQAAVKIDKALV